jgi:hypothetical protein
MMTIAREKLASGDRDRLLALICRGGPSVSNDPAAGGTLLAEKSNIKLLQRTLAVG